MNRVKICVYAICKNEEMFVDRWMDSMNEADMVVVTDTGSTDGTVEKLRARGAVVYVDIVKPWRFDVARNISLSHVPQDADICVCTDLDEYFLPGWREKLEKAWIAHGETEPAGLKVAQYVYNWSLKSDGSPDVQFHYRKAHQREGFCWKCPVHEHISPVKGGKLSVVYVEGMVLNHAPDPTKSRGSYLPLLELGVLEAPLNERMRYYLGREYMYRAEWEKCIQTLREYLALPGATWNEERCAAMRWIAKAHFESGNAHEAKRWYFRAIAEAPYLRDPYVEFAQMSYRRADWPTVLFLCEEALKIPARSKTYVNMGYSWDHTPNDLCAIAAYNMGLYEKSLVHAQAALAISPNNARLIANLERIRAKAVQST